MNAVSAKQALASSEYVNIADGRHVYAVQLPDGSKIGLTAEQAVGAVVKPHGNHGRCKIRFTLVIEVQAQGTATANERDIAKGLLEEVHRLRDELSSTRERLHGMSDARALKVSLDNSKELLSEWIKGSVNDEAAGENLTSRTQALLDRK